MYPWNMEIKNAVSRLSALAHESRLDLVKRLIQAGPDGLPAGELARAAGLNFTTASGQLLVLTNAGLARSERRGRSVIYKADYTAMRDLIGFLMKDCCRGQAEILSPLADVADGATTSFKPEREAP
jgi:DNA-binding transcriptional ArsR family regulator